jgi:hypothetical protein
LIDQLQIDRLVAGEDPAVRDLFEQRVVHATPLFHKTAKPRVGVLHQRIERRPRGLAGRFKAVGGRFQRRRLHFLDLDAHGFQQIGKIRKLKQHADRTDQRGLLRYDVIGRDRGDVAAGCRQSLDHHDHRLLRFQAHQRVEQLLGAGRGTAGRIDMHDDGRGLRLFQPLQRLDAIIVAADQAVDMDACNRA